MAMLPESELRSRETQADARLNVASAEWTAPASSEERQDRKLVLAVSTLMLGMTGFLIFLVPLNTLLKQVFCVFSFSFAIAGFYNLFPGKAQLTVGKWFAASGAIAVAIFLLITVLNSTGLVRFKLSDLAALPAASETVPVAV